MPSFSNQIFISNLHKQLVAILLLCMVSVGCSTVDKAKESPVVKPAEQHKPAVPSVTDAGPIIESIDEVALQQALGLAQPKESLGFSERKFNTCEVGYGYSNVHNCRDLYLTVIHFQMLCRNSEGTVSEVVNSADLIKNADRNLSWDLKGNKGRTMTDGSGYSQIRVISQKSQKQQRFKIALKNDFLYLMAGEVAKIITPSTWCRL